MGVNYTDDLSGKQIDSNVAYRMEFTKFDGDKMIKSKVFYVGIESVKKVVGTQELGWITSQKGPDGKYHPIEGSP